MGPPRASMTSATRTPDQITLAAAPTPQGDPDAPCGKYLRPRPEHWSTAATVIGRMRCSSPTVTARGLATPPTSMAQAARSSRIEAGGSGRLPRTKTLSVGVTRPRWCSRLPSSTRGFSWWTWKSAGSSPSGRPGARGGLIAGRGAVAAGGHPGAGRSRAEGAAKEAAAIGSFRGHGRRRDGDLGPDGRGVGARSPGLDGRRGGARPRVEVKRRRPVPPAPPPQDRPQERSREPPPANSSFTGGVEAPGISGSNTSGALTVTLCA